MLQWKEAEVDSYKATSHCRSVMVFVVRVHLVDQHMPGRTKKTHFAQLPKGCIHHDPEQLLVVRILHHGPYRHSCEPRLHQTRTSPSNRHVTEATLPKPTM
jgi:hypothetical protein